jgi:hypothetical protein
VDEMSEILRRSVWEEAFEMRTIFRIFGTAMNQTFYNKSFGIIILLCSTFSTIAQESFTASYKIEDVKYSKSETHVYRGWLDPVKGARVISKFYENGDFVDSVGILYPDSNVMVINQASSEMSQDIHSVGIILDPEAYFFELIDDGMRQTRGQSLDLDSIAFPYIYNRPIDSTYVKGSLVEVIDTLEIHLFKRWHLRLDTVRKNGKEFLSARPEQFSGDTLGYELATCASKLLLTGDLSTTSSDTSNGVMKLFKIAIPPSVGQSIPRPDNFKNNLFGFSITFKPMVKTQTRDTLVALDGTEVTKRTNYFGYSLVLNSNTHLEYLDQDRGHLNTAFFTHTEQRHGRQNRGWADNTPGNALENAWYFEAYFHTSFHVGFDDRGESNSHGVTVFPNPSDEKLFIETPNQSCNIHKIVIRDLRGCIVIEVPVFDVVPLHQIDISSLAKGIYLFEIELDNFTDWHRIIIQ